MIKSISLKGFRNYKNAYLEIIDKINFLVGDNGQGKTNFLEAIYLLSFIKSFRKSTDKELVCDNEAAYYIKGEFINEEISSIEIGFDKKNKLVKVNGKRINSLKEILGKLNVILFSDKDIDLIYLGPSIRRRYIDSILSIVDLSYFDALSSYQKVLKQRNAALKAYQTRQSDKNSVKVWDDQLIYFGSILTKRRAIFINEINKICNAEFPKFTSGKLSMELKYKSRIHSDEDESIRFKYLLEKEFNREVSFGNTIIGPHRDDMLIKDKKKLLKSHASKGQARAAALLLRLAQMLYIEKFKKYYSILLLDDILLDLDKNNKKIFLDIIGDKRQCFFTATSKEEFTKMKGSLFQVNEGSIRNSL